MNDKELSGWVRSLPRASASPSFNRDVLRKVRHARAGKDATPPVWKVAVAFAIAACLLLGVQFAIVRQAERERFAALRMEQQKLEAELEAVKQLARDAEPMVVLENDEGTRVIIDADSAVQPATFRHYD